MEDLPNHHQKMLKKKQYERKHYRLSSYTCKIWSMVIVCVCLLMAASALMYFLLVKSPSEPDSVGRMLLAKGTEWVAKCSRKYVRLADRFDCYPEDSNVDRHTCESRGCCFLDVVDEQVTTDVSVTRCIYPENYGYVMKDGPKVTEKGFELSLQRLSSPSRYGDDIHVVNVLVEKQTPYRLRIKFYDAVSDRYEVPTPKIPVSERTDRHKKEEDLYSVSYNSSRVPLALKVGRQLTATTLFDTSAGALALSHHFLELSTLLPSANVYGISGHVGNQFGAGLNWKTWSLFNSPVRKQNGVHPMYLCIEGDGRAHGVLLLNSNAMEIKLLPKPAVTFRTIGGVLDFYLFLGPTPEEVARQYNEAVGQPPLPPYWALGLHVGSGNSRDIEKFVRRWRAVDIPWEVVYYGPDVLDLYSAGSREMETLSNLTAELQATNRKVIIPVRSSVTVDETLNSIYKIGLKHSAFMLDKWGLPLYGEINGQEVVYGDYGSGAGMTWWSDIVQKLFSGSLRFDGIALVDNEPLSDVNGGIHGCMNDDLNRPPYTPRNKVLYERTICMDAIQHWEDTAYAHYHLHNLYGHIMAITTQKVLKLLPDKQRKLLTSQSTFAGSGHFVGHWFEGFADSWDTFEAAIRVALDYNIYGIPLVGTRVCHCPGDLSERDEKLVLRWIQLSVFFPLFGLFDCGDQKTLCTDGQRNQEYTRSVQQSVRGRYELLPYLYTLFYRAHVEGCTVMRSLSHEFPIDNSTHAINSQFMWGSALLISPVIKQNATRVRYYLPQGIWYRLYEGDLVVSESEWFDESLEPCLHCNPAVLHLRAGQIIVLQQPSGTTAESRQNAMRLLVALNSSYEAEGILYWDDGLSRDSMVLGEYKLVHFTVLNHTLTVDAGSKSARLNFNLAYIQHVQVMGLVANPKLITINDGYTVIRKQKRWNSATKVLDVKGILIPLEGTTRLKW